MRIIVALGLLFFVFFGSIPNEININPIPDEVDEVEEIINIDKPSDAILSMVRPVADLIKQPEDRAKIALFNHEFASRINRYHIDCQQLNDLYSNAGKKFFGESLRGKYNNFSQSLVDLFQSVVTEENHVLTKDEKESLSKLFDGLAWALVEK